MKFPLVSRAAYDDMVALLRDERARYDKILELVLRLKASGATVIQERVVQATTPDDATRIEGLQKIQRAIDASKHSRNPFVRAKLQDFATKELARGTSVDAIEDRLLNWDKVAQQASEDNDDGDTIAVVM